MKFELLYGSDSYKVGHHQQYPEDVTKIYSYFEARGFKEPFITEPSVVVYGLDYLLENLEGIQFTKEGIEEAKEFYKNHFGYEVFNEEGFIYLLEKHNGTLPLKIKAVPEGSVVPIGNVLMTVENTDSDMPGETAKWLTNYVETYLTHLWYTTSVATLSREIKALIAAFAFLTLSAKEFEAYLPFALHDFGMRGSVGHESAYLAGAAHLINFLGTDTTSAMRFIEKFHGKEEQIPGYSVMASEHSVMTINGKEGEKDQFKKLIDLCPEEKIVSIVSDSYNIYNVVENWVCGEFKDEILSGTKKIVIRPDSGDPKKVLTRILNILEDNLEISINERGYKVLPPQIGLIWGDGIGLEDIRNILSMMTTSNWATSNIVFGMGGGLHQKVNRDSLKFAFKACYAEKRDGTTIDIYKDPITDQGKSSKKGKLKLIEDSKTGDLVTVSSSTDPKLYAMSEELGDDQLKIAFLNGKIVRQKSKFSEIRERAKLTPPKTTIIDITN